MAKVHFAPYSAIRYVGEKPTLFATSLARPKPMLEVGDIVITDKRTAFNLVHKGFGNFEMVEDVVSADAEAELPADAKSKKGFKPGLKETLSGSKE
ncbi:MAG: hypothetical protein IBX43_04945 [Campylobacterales bacterium]|nr:hypothetical protein [Campylobacterales bacterium]